MNIFKKLVLNHKLLILILVVAAFLRLWRLGATPPALTPDEASLGYNAYSILKTSRDEFGVKLPIIFKSFGDYKPGLYVYLTAPSIFTFGLSEFSTRLPSALFGILSVYLIYLVVGKMFPDQKKLPVVAAFVAATNPYLIYFSRGAWEANVSLTLTIAGIYLFLVAIEKKKYLLPSSAMFALTLLVYQGAKLSTAIVVALLVIIFWKKFWKIEKICLIVGITGALLISMPIVTSMFSGQTQRLAIFSIFSYPRPQSEIQTYAGPLYNIFHSDALNYLRMIMSRWFNFFSGEFLFFAGDLANPVHTPPYQGVLLLIDLLLLPIGLFNFFSSKSISRKSLLFILSWLILAPLSAAISRDQTNAVRSLSAAVPIIIIISFGLSVILNWISNQKYRFPFYILLSVFYLLSFAYFIDAYFIHLPSHNSNYWRYGYKQAVEYISPIQANYTNIVFEQSFNQPYIYFLFFQKYDPAKYQKEANLVSSEYIGDVGYQTKLSNIKFERIDWSVLRNSHNTLVVTNPGSIPPEILSNPSKFSILKEIKYLNGRDVAFDIIEIK